MFKKRNILIGTAGIVLTILTAVILFSTGELTQPQEVAVVMPSIALVIFFVGYLFGGFLTALSFGGIMSAALLVIAAPSSLQGPLALILLASLFLGPKLKAFILSRRSKALDDVTAELSEHEAEKQLEEVTQRVFANAVYLIKPNSLKADVTYKVVNKDDSLLFFRVGGQFYDIDPEIAVNEKLDISDVDAIKGSFILKKSDVQYITIKTKHRMWTGEIENNGTVCVAVTGGETSYIIHGINDYPMVQKFFGDALGYPVNMILDKKRTRKEKRDRAFELRNLPEKSRIRKIAGALNAAGILSGIWLICYPRPVQLSVAVGIILPIAAMIFYLKNSRFVTLDEHKGQKLPSVGSALVVPPWALMIVALLGFNIIYSWKMWLAIVLVSLAASVFIIIKSKEFQLQKSLLFCIPVMVCVYVFGAAVTSNCLYDYHTPEIKKLHIVDKDYSEGSKYDKYHIELESWRSDRETVRASVSRGKYEAFEVGSEVSVRVSKGLWGIEWYIVYSLPDSAGDVSESSERGLLGAGD